MPALFSGSVNNGIVTISSISPAGVHISELPANAWGSEALPIFGFKNSDLRFPVPAAASYYSNPANVIHINTKFYREEPDPFRLVCEYQEGVLFFDEFFGREKTICAGFNITYKPDLTKPGILFSYMASPWADGHIHAHDSTAEEDFETGYPPDVEYFDGGHGSIRGEARRILHEGLDLRTDSFSLVTAALNFGCGGGGGEWFDEDTGEIVIIPIDDFGYCHQKTRHWYLPAEESYDAYGNSYFQIFEGVERIYSIELIFIEDGAGPSKFWTGFKNCTEV
jgi:hypothetical protein